MAEEVTVFRMRCDVGTEMMMRLADLEWMVASVPEPQFDYLVEWRPGSIQAVKLPPRTREREREYPRMSVILCSQGTYDAIQSAAQPAESPVLGVPVYLVTEDQSRRFLVELVRDLAPVDPLLRRL